MRLNNPHDYRPHRVVLEARDSLLSIVRSLSNDDTTIATDLRDGKMLGVLVVRTPMGEVGYLAGFSGEIGGRSILPHFVPPIFDINSEGCYFAEDEKAISQVTHQIEQIENSDIYHSAKEAWEVAQHEAKVQIERSKDQYKKAKAERDEARKSGKCSDEELAQINRESQHQKGEMRRLEASIKANVEQKRAAYDEIISKISSLRQLRTTMSNELQHKIFDSYRVVNGFGEWRSLRDIFEQQLNRLPPAGTGECAAPKLLHYALTHNYTPLSIGEFWVGKSPRGEVRHDGEFYGACRGKCHPILKFVLQGVEMESHHLPQERDYSFTELEILYEDQELVAINKPSGLLSVEGKDGQPSLEQIVREHYTEKGVTTMMVHRLDQDTSGIIVITKSNKAHYALQSQFIRREIEKNYIAIVEGIVEPSSGEINLPLRPNPLDRPRQMVDHDGGKEATTSYKVIEVTERGWSRLSLTPHSGRTHQLRLHCLHPEGLGHPIAGDRLYGSGTDSAERLLLHAESIRFTHPSNGEVIKIHCEAPF